MGEWIRVKLFTSFVCNLPSFPLLRRHHGQRRAKYCGADIFQERRGLLLRSSRLSQAAVHLAKLHVSGCSIAIKTTLPGAASSFSIQGASSARPGNFGGIIEILRGATRCSVEGQLLPCPEFSSGSMARRPKFA